ncbi:hypothetical protein [Nocardiopsis synnemataformans]|uniref:hypothetical protein n=1 Tax=Nocardiopsis synnemataformans TaxID=61305 RepID=UPI003EC035F3
MSAYVKPETSFTNPYLDWTPAEHGEGCTQQGWQVRTYEPTMPREHEHTIALRAVCTECGVSYELAARTGGQDEHGDQVGPYIVRFEDRHEGYRATPVKVGGLWLHAWRGVTRRFDPDAPARDYAAYYLTASSAPPADPVDVIGLVHFGLSKRGRQRWRASLAGPVHTTASGARWFTAHQTPGDERLYTTPQAAARWIARTHKAHQETS